MSAVDLPLMIGSYIQKYELLTSYYGGDASEAALAIGIPRSKMEGGSYAEKEEKMIDSALEAIASSIEAHASELIRWYRTIEGRYRESL